MPNGEVNMTNSIQKIFVVQNAPKRQSADLPDYSEIFGTTFLKYVELNVDPLIISPPPRL